MQPLLHPGMGKHWLFARCVGLIAANVVADATANAPAGYIAWSTDTPWVEDICASIDRLLPELNHYGGTLIESEKTGHPEKIKPRKAEFQKIWAGCTLRNDRMRRVTGLEFRPLDESVRDCVESLISVGGVKVRTKAAKL